MWSDDTCESRGQAAILAQDSTAEMIETGSVRRTENLELAHKRLRRRWNKAACLQGGVCE